MPTARQRFEYVRDDVKEPIAPPTGLVGNPLDCPVIPASFALCRPFFGGYGVHAPPPSATRSAFGNAIAILNRAAMPAGYASSLFPFPNNPWGPYGRNTYTAVLPADGDGDLFSARVDRNITVGGTSHVLTARYNLTDEDSILPVTDGAIYSSLRPLVRIHNIATFFNSTFSPTVLNTFRFGWGRTSLDFTAVRDPSLVSSEARDFIKILENTPSLSIPDDPFLLNRPMLLALKGRSPAFKTGCRNGWQCDDPNRPYLNTTESIVGPVGRVNFSGFSPMGVDPAHFPQTRANNTGQLADTLTFVRNRHELAVGFEFWRFALNSDVE